MNWINATVTELEQNKKQKVISKWVNVVLSPYCKSKYLVISFKWDINIFNNWLSRLKLINKLGYRPSDFAKECNFPSHLFLSPKNPCILSTKWDLNLTNFLTNSEVQKSQALNNIIKYQEQQQRWLLLITSIFTLSCVWACKWKTAFDSTKGCLYMIENLNSQQTSILKSIWTIPKMHQRMADKV